MLRITSMMRLLACVLVVSSLGCAHRTVRRIDRSQIITEQGIRYAAEEWNEAYVERQDFCSERYPAQTPAAETCFGTWYDADAKVRIAVKAAVAVLRGYWLARSVGERPDWQEVARNLVEIFADVPPPADLYFRRVQGL